MSARTDALMVTVAEAAAVLGVCANTLKRAGEDGDVPLLQIRSVYLVPKAWLAHVTSWPAVQDPAPAGPPGSPAGAGTTTAAVT